MHKEKEPELTFLSIEGSIIVIAAAKDSIEITGFAPLLLSGNCAASYGCVANVDYGQGNLGS